MTPVESPWDHNAECRYCDEQGMHRADCSWLMALEARVASLEAELQTANELANQIQLRLKEQLAALRELAEARDVAAEWQALEPPEEKV
jgi:hypothetical protein